MKKRWLIWLCLGLVLTGYGAERAIPAKDVLIDTVKMRIFAEGGQQVENLRNLQMENQTVDAEMAVSTNACQKAAYLADCVYEATHANTLVSPLSLNMALGLAAEGASDDVAKELYDYLGREDYGAFAKEYMGFAEGLTKEQGSVPYMEGYSFRYELANSLWINEQNEVLDSYRKSVEEKFRAKVETVDFAKDIPATVKKINSWCEEKTHHLIPEIITEGDVDPYLKVLLINSLYFESPWTEVWGLRDDFFTDVKGNKTEQEMLHGKVDAYYENDQAIAFGKKYYNGFEFIGILPKAEGDFRISELNLESLLASRSTDYVVRALMPKLEFDTTAEHVEKILEAQGITKPFSDVDAGFDQMIQLRDGEKIFIDEILQKCRIELDENGTKAAAVTAAMVRTMAMEPLHLETREVNLDRPFAFLIYDSTNEEITFVGKVTEL